MKKDYSELELEVIRFGAEDIITASAEDTEDSCGADVNLDGYTLIQEQADYGLYLGPDGHYYVIERATGQIMHDFGTSYPGM